MKRIALLAGSGYLPLLWLQEAGKQGYEVVAISLASPKEEEALRPLVKKLYSLPHASWRLLLDILHKEDVQEIVSLGAFDKRMLFKGCLKDWQLLKILWGVRKSDQGIIAALLAQLDKEGIRLLAQQEILQDFMAPLGTLAGPTSISPSLQKDIQLAWQQAKDLSALAIGQVVVVKEGLTLALEAAEGTDATLKRAFDLAGGGYTVAKVAWPNSPAENHELPAIGEETMDILLATKAKALVLEAHKVILLEASKILKKANDSGLLVLAREE